MFIDLKLPWKKRNRLEETLDTLLINMEKVDPTSEAYSQMADQVVKLTKAIENAPRLKISPDALLAAGVSLVTVIAILHAERTDVIVTKALSFIPKLK